jgi:SAM-dependent methyltransferase
VSGFDPAWLDLREPADHAARAPDVLAAVVERFGGRGPLSVADLGAGSGSTLRALAPLLGRRQSWTLLDNDPALLAHAADRLAAWADAAERQGDLLRLWRAGAVIEVRAALCDLAREPLPPAAAAADLVTASALFDLVGEAWMQKFVAALAAAGRPLYAALSHEGVDVEPSHPFDDPAFAAFERHQATDKGFGPALGERAGAALLAAARQAGFQAVSGPSPWRLGPGESAALKLALIDGWAEAIAATPGVAPEALAEWLAFRRAAAVEGAVRVRHVDLLLVPPNAG